MGFTTTREQVLVSTGWLAEHLNDPDLCVLDCRHYFDRHWRPEYEAGHIPGALHLDVPGELKDPNHPVDSMMPPPEQVEAVMSRLGIGNTTQIVAYDDEGGHYASRVWLILARYGHEHQIRMLEGGWTKWVHEGRPVSTEIPTPQPATFTIDPNAGHPELIAELQDVQAVRESGNGVLLDVRRMSEYTGEEVRAKHGGRIPGAVHLLWQENLNWDDKRDFRADPEIRALHEERGITHGTPVITYCQGGVRAAHAALALWMNGYNNVRVYDGSWTEWGNHDDLPIETGPATEQ